MRSELTAISLGCSVSKAERFLCRHAGSRCPALLKLSATVALLESLHDWTLLVAVGRPATESSCHLCLHNCHDPDNL